MSRDDIRKLVGGYATGTLSDAERALLFEAALDDQDLFNELADEHALKELLEEPGVRQRLAASLAPQNVALPLRWWMRPWPVSAVASLALGVLVTVAVLRTPEPRESAAVVSAPVSNAITPESSFVGFPPNTPPPAKSAPRLARTVPPQEELKKDAANASPAPEPPKAETPAQANESDRKEKVLTDAVQQPGQQQSPPQTQQQTQPGGQQAQAAPSPQPQQVAVAGQQAAQSFAEAEQRRDQAAGGAVQNQPAPAKSKLAPARQAVALAVPAPNAPPAFTWSIENGILRVTPGRDGALRMEAAPGEPVVIANARRGVAAEFAIPAGAASVRVSFSAQNVSADALSRAENQRAGSRAAGSVFMPAGAPNGPVSIEIPLR